MDIIKYNQVDSHLSDLFNTEFSTDDQKQFILHFQMYLQYGGDNTQFVIDLDHVWNWLGFSTKGNAKKCLMKYFQEGSDYKNLLIQMDKQNGHGGHNKETVQMKIDTFKTFCMLANTEKGKQTRAYYSKMESIFFKYLQEKQANDLLQLENNLSKSIAKQEALKVHNKLINTYKNQPLVYVIKITEDDGNGNYHVKIGETEDIKQRVISHKISYECCVLLDVYPCLRPHHLEQYILKRNDIKAHRIPRTEIIQISPEFPYEKLTKAIEKSIDYFDSPSIEQKIEMLKEKNKTLFFDCIKNLTDLGTLTTDAADIKQRINDMMDKLQDFYQSNTISSSQNQNQLDSDLEEMDTTQIPTVSNRLVYKYNPDNLTEPIATFNSLREAARSVNDHDYNLRQACLNNKLLAGFRWYMLDNVAPDFKPDNIPETVVYNASTKPLKNTGLIAQVSEDGKIILNVFPNQKIAEEVTQIPSCQICTAMKLKRKTHGYFFQKYEECDDELKQTYKDPLPNTKKNTTCAKGVNMLSPTTNEIIETFSCIQEVSNKYRICHKTINKIVKTGEIYRGYKWAFT